MMSKTFNKYIIVLDDADKTQLVFSGARNGVSLGSFTTVTGAAVGIAGASISLVFLTGNGIVKMFLKIIGRRKNKHRKIALLARSILNSTEKII